MVVYQQRPHPRVVLRHPWVVAGVTEGVLVEELGAMDLWEYNKVHRWAPIWTQDLYNPHLEDCSKFGLEIHKKKTLFLQTSSVYYWLEKNRNHFLTLTKKIYYPDDILKSFEENERGFLLFLFSNTGDIRLVSKLELFFSHRNLTVRNVGWPAQFIFSCFVFGGYQWTKVGQSLFY